MPSAYEVKIRMMVAAWAWLDLHLVAVGSRPALLVHPHFPDGHRAVAERLLADEEATFLLTDLTAQRLLLEVPELELVEDAADLDGERRLLVVAVETVGDRNHADALEVELSDDREHEVVVTGEPRQIVDEHHIEFVVVSRCHERGETRPIRASTRLGLVGVDVIVGDR